MNSFTAVICFSLLLAIVAISPSHAAFGGQPPLGPKDSLRHLFKPYDLMKLNYLGMNYCENLLDFRTNATSYTHLNYDNNALDAWHLQFPDDVARLIESVTWEDQFSPVVRLELGRRLTKGIAAVHLPGTRTYYSFRNRIGGKTLLIFDDEDSAKQGRLMLSNWGDAIEGMAKIGFRVEKDGTWFEIDKFAYKDEPERAGRPDVARSQRYWNESPFVIRRHFSTEGQSVDFAGKYWMSDEDRPLEYAFAAKDADSLEIVVGEPDKPMPLFVGGGGAAGIIHLPDRKTVFRSDKDGDKVIERPGFNYIVLRKQTAWACPGYSAALLIMWEGKPERIEAISKNGYGEIRVSYASDNKSPAGKVWLFPFQWLNEDDMEYVYRNAESYLEKGRMIHNGLPTQQLVNAVPSGLAAGAYLLTKYNDPYAPTARINAQNAVDEVFEGIDKGRWYIRAFFPVRAAAWMVKTGKEMNDKEMVQKYTRMLETGMKLMLSSDVGYNGKAWASGWDHFNATKSVWLAYDATGNEEYFKVYERAQSIFSIDEKGIYREGKPLDAPGGFETYAGAQTLGVWGLDGKLDWVEKLINLDVPNGWHDPKTPVKDVWNDAGAGPWAQDDANPEYLGISMRGAKLPQDRKYMLPVGAFPTYDWKGNVAATHEPVLENPFFPKKNETVRILTGNRKLAYKSEISNVTPGSSEEQQIIVRETGKVQNKQRVCSASALPLIYRFDTGKADGAGIDLLLKGSYIIDVSPDGKRWYKRLDSWSDRSEWRSLDLSFLTGGHDELIKIMEIVPPGDDQYQLENSKSTVEREHCRYTNGNGSFGYRLDLDGVKEAYIELMIGNAYKVSCSSDGKNWTDEINADHPKVSVKADAAWLRTFDITKYLAKGDLLFVNIENDLESKNYEDCSAFVRRTTVYGRYDSPHVYVRISNASKDPDASFVVENVVFRTWKNP